MCVKTVWESMNMWLTDRAFPLYRILKGIPEEGETKGDWLDKEWKDK